MVGKYEERSWAKTKTDCYHKAKVVYLISFDGQFKLPHYPIFSDRGLTLETSAFLIVHSCNLNLTSFPMEHLPECFLVLQH